MINDSSFNTGREINTSLEDKQDALVSGTNIKTVDGQTVLGLGDLKSVKMVLITWADLKALRDAGNLIPGMQYRITDYVCTTVQEDSHSVGNKFDIIVTADAPSVLNERARAAHHTPDVYVTTFSDGVKKSCYVRYAQRVNWKLMYVVIDSATLKCCGAYAEDLSFNGMNLTVSNHASTDLTVSKTEEYCDYFHYTNFAKWELKYSLDNDTDRFAWADAVNGKGVIYWMKDEFGNECPYDFKNIVFDRKACIIANVVSNTQYFEVYHRDPAADITISDVPYYAYTNDDNTRTTIYFLSSGQLSVGSQAYDSDGNAISGVTLQYYLNSDCYNIFTFTNSLLNIESDTTWSSDASLNVSYSTDHWEISVNCYRNIVNFHTTAAGIKSLNKESLGFNIIQGKGNILGVGCHRNMVLRSETVLGSLCYDNVLNAGNSSTGGVLGSACHAIQSYGSNIFGASCKFIRLPSLARGNVFGASCSMIHLSSGSVENNMFGDNCGFITCGQIMLRCVFEKGCSNISILNRLYDCSFASQCQYLIVQAATGNTIYNVCVHKGVSGTSAQSKSLSLSTSETTETNVYTTNSSDVRV